MVFFIILSILSTSVDNSSFNGILNFIEVKFSIFVTGSISSLELFLDRCYGWISVVPNVSDILLKLIDFLLSDLLDSFSEFLPGDGSILVLVHHTEDHMSLILSSWLVVLPLVTTFVCVYICVVFLLSISLSLDTSIAFTKSTNEFFFAKFSVFSLETFENWFEMFIIYWCTTGPKLFDRQIIVSISIASGEEVSWISRRTLWLVFSIISVFRWSTGIRLVKSDSSDGWDECKCKCEFHLCLFCFYLL